VVCKCDGEGEGEITMDMGLGIWKTVDEERVWKVGDGATNDCVPVNQLFFVIGL